MSDHQDAILNALLVLVTDPQQVKQNIIKLQSDKLEVKKLIDEANEKNSDAEQRHAEALQIEGKNKLAAEALAAREIEVKSKEDHWFQRDDEQKATEKKFNEEKLVHAENVRKLALREQEVNVAEKSIEQAKVAALSLHAKAKDHESSAADLKKAYEDRLEQIKLFATQVAK